MSRRMGVVVAVFLSFVALAACGTTNEETGGSQPQGASLRVTLGTQEFPEARIIGELWRQALAVNGYTVDLRKGSDLRRTSTRRRSSSSSTWG